MLLLIKIASNASLAEAICQHAVQISPAVYCLLSFDFSLPDKLSKFGEYKTSALHRSVEPARAIGPALGLDFT
jgi:hypothetical protein